MPDGPLTSCDLSSVDLDARLGAPVVPPIEWLTEKPAWAAPGMDPTVDTCNEIGRGFGYVAAWKTRFLNHHPLLQSARQLRNADTSYFNRRRVPVIDESGEQTTVLAGVIGAGHSPDSLTTVQQIQQFHDQPDRALLIARYDTDDFGAFVNFVMIPEATWAQTIQVQRSAFSGEWFPLTHSIDTGERLSRPVWAVLAPALVSHPALPLPVEDRKIGPGGVLAAGVQTLRSYDSATLSDDEPPSTLEIRTMADTDTIEVDGVVYRKVAAATDDSSSEQPNPVQARLAENDPEAFEMLQETAARVAALEEAVAELMAGGAEDEVPMNEG